MTSPLHLRIPDDDEIADAIESRAKAIYEAIFWSEPVDTGTWEGALENGPRSARVAECREQARKELLG
jgi:hypothetical protein